MRWVCCFCLCFEEILQFRCLEFLWAWLWVAPLFLLHWLICSQCWTDPIYLRYLSYLNYSVARSTWYNYLSTDLGFQKRGVWLRHLPLVWCTEVLSGSSDRWLGLWLALLHLRFGLHQLANSLPGWPWSLLYFHLSHFGYLQKILETRLHQFQKCGNFRCVECITCL